MNTADKPNILIVDDEPKNLFALRALLDGADRPPPWTTRLAFINREDAQ
jgi:hypothetical protein